LSPPGVVSPRVVRYVFLERSMEPYADRRANGGRLMEWGRILARLIGSIRRECTDHLIVVNEEHLRQILAKFAAYYNHARTHTSLGKDAPYTRPIERFGHVVAHPILGGLHHRYARI
jgi:hypothetical protein